MEDRDCVMGVVLVRVVVAVVVAVVILGKSSRSFEASSEGS